MNKLNDKYVNKTINEFKKLEQLFYQRIDYIVKVINKTFKTKINYNYSGDNDESVINMYDEVELYINIYSNRDLCIILSNNDEWNLRDSIPSRWLFEDFEEELKQGYKRHKEKIKNIDTKKSKLIKS